ncbi:MAG: ribonuclease HII [Rikenellaceae bacterium]
MLLQFQNKDLIEAGVDEAGRGCLAGSLFAAAVILPPDFYHPLLNDSKKMSEKNRYILRDIIIEKAIAWSVAEVTAEEIDEINVLNAAFLGMNRAIESLKVTPEKLLIDGNRFRSNTTIPYECIVKGDGKFASIAAASVLAKTFRDDYITALDKDYPEYGWAKNKSYGTAAHRKAIEEYGLSPLHRKSFKIKGDLELF